MILILVIVFIALVVLDTVFTYKVLAKGGYVEKKYWHIKWPVKFKLPTLMGVCISHPVVTVVITIIGAGFLMLFLILLGITWFLIFPSIAFGYACLKSWRALKS